MFAIQVSSFSCRLLHTQLSTGFRSSEFSGHKSGRIKLKFFFCRRAHCHVCDALVHYAVEKPRFRVPMHPGKSWIFQALESQGKSVWCWKVLEMKA